MSIKNRASAFLDLFTEDERRSWEGSNGRIPNWAVLAVAYFLGEEPETKELMKRLKESGD